jgi:hypothetical protein
MESVPNSDPAAAEAARARNAAKMAFKAALDQALAEGVSGGGAARNRLSAVFVDYVTALGATNADKFRTVVCGLASSAVQPKAEDKPGDKAEGDQPKAEGDTAPQGDVKPEASPQGEAPKVEEPKAQDTAGVGVPKAEPSRLLLAIRSMVDGLLAGGDVEAQRDAIRVLSNAEVAIHEAVQQLRAAVAAAKPVAQAEPKAAPKAAEPKAAAKPGKPGGPASVAEKRDIAERGQTLMGQAMGKALAAKQAAAGGNVPAAEVLAAAAKRKTAAQRGVKPGRGKAG